MMVALSLSRRASFADALTSLKIAKARAASESVVKPAGPRNTAIVASGFVVLKEELYDAGERFYSTLGFAVSIPAGTAYLVCISISVASSLVALSAKGATSAGWFREFYSVLEFVACILTYIATAAFATSLGRARWLGPIPACAFAAACANWLHAPTTKFSNVLSGAMPGIWWPTWIASRRKNR